MGNETKGLRELSRQELADNATKVFAGPTSHHSWPSK
ncbi:hypothetical protein C8J28_14810 [Cereibacter azotoformans]|uniref:Uncharacterized protein n=1 Tax=Cereibacter azotoformans TaxID=43057 RepID=A0A2T5JK02_9RHOB|nr:hypothetical protein C8J28_14810 [Cereibacter azotoformans]